MLSRSLILAFVFLGLIIFLSPAKATERPASDIGMDDRIQLFVTVKSDFDLVEAGRSIPVVVEVYDPHNVPQPNIPVHLEVSFGSAEPSQVRTDHMGRAAFTFRAHTEETREAIISARTDVDEAIQGYDELRVSVVHLPPPPIYSRTEVISVGIISLILGIIAKTEVGRYSLLSFFTFPLYIRLKKEEVLEHFVRGQIYGFIRSNPGAHYSMIRDTLKVTNGTLSHHLKTLEVQGFIHSQRDGVYKRFYPVDFEIRPEGRGIRLSELQAKILDRLRRDGDVLQGELARELNVTQQCISYNLRLMCREELVERQRLGKRVLYRAAEN